MAGDEDGEVRAALNNLKKQIADAKKRKKALASELAEIQDLTA